ncbi:hypothetical protein [Methylobacterium oryzihabitans]|uniref:Uncharacterized protein n=1 Tax=Methylobacterium oryzihabitans TaxID=2499852 RepID=A0A3S2W6P9_9HYPH|nr:hypothetical protein [Methylobacterium oryzihabitans]RVU15061.1 hypothetical protein EOE48_20895 [Methylobacterium oryzihabitans]
MPDHPAWMAGGDAAAARPEKNSVVRESGPTMGNPVGTRLSRQSDLPLTVSGGMSCRAGELVTQGSGSMDTACSSTDEESTLLNKNFMLHCNYACELSKLTAI